MCKDGCTNIARPASARQRKRRRRRVCGAQESDRRRRRRASAQTGNRKKVKWKLVPPCTLPCDAARGVRIRAPVFLVVIVVGNDHCGTWHYVLRDFLGGRRPRRGGLPPGMCRLSLHASGVRKLPICQGCKQRGRVRNKCKCWRFWISFSLF